LKLQEPPKPQSQSNAPKDAPSAAETQRKAQANGSVLDPKSQEKHDKLPLQSAQKAKADEGLLNGKHENQRNRERVGQ
jgi:hypothetical protein